MRRIILIWIVFSSFLIGHAKADEITLAIDKALARYELAEYSGAIAELNRAVELLSAKLTTLYEDAFPTAQSGFITGKLESSRLGMSLLDGGISITRTDTLTTGGIIRLEMVSNSPMLTAVVMMLENPVFLGGKEMITVGVEKATKEWENDTQTGEIRVPIAKKLLLSIRGQDVPFETVMAYAENFDYPHLKALVK